MKTKRILTAGLFSLCAANVSAQELSISFTNLTQGFYFTPLIVASHDQNASIFTVATSASSELQALAEGGDISGVSAMLTTANADIVENPAAGLLAPTSNVELNLSTSDGNNVLSLASMLLPTNDAFVGLDSWPIPTTAGTYVVWLNAYDAGTEANDELIVGGAGGAPGTPGIPAAPGGDVGMNGTGLTDTQTNTNVHIHRGALGDDDLTGGQSDLDNRVHRWLNPVAKVTITVE